jgi:hypothetical protein
VSYKAKKMCCFVLLDCDIGWRGNWIWCRRSNGSKEMNQFSFRAFSSLGGKHSEMTTEINKVSRRLPNDLYKNF